jgi:hypothetical protein
MIEMSSGIELGFTSIANCVAMFYIIGLYCISRMKSIKIAHQRCKPVKTRSRVSHLFLSSGNRLFEWHKQ